MVASADPLPIADEPIKIEGSHSVSDWIFHRTVLAISILVLVIFGSIGLFLALKSTTTFDRYGWAFFGTKFDFDFNEFGILPVLLGTFEVALVALVVAFPLALATGLFISEYVPPRLRSSLVAMVDLMAAVPSVVYGAWGALFLMPDAKYVSRWIAQNLGWIPIFRVDGDPNSPTWAQSRFVGSAFIAGVCVAMMVIPIACSVMRGVFAQAPAGEREAAYALGSTRWGMIRAVVMPFGRGGIIGGTMLGMGRALGETITVLLVLSYDQKANFRILQSGNSTISFIIANFFGAASHLQLAALLTAGLVLFAITLVVNTLAAIVIGRSRSGSTTDI